MLSTDRSANPISPPNYRFACYKMIMKSNKTCFGKTVVWACEKAIRTRRCNEDGITGEKKGMTAGKVDRCSRHADVTKTESPGRRRA